MSTIDVKVPNIGDFKEVEVIELMVKVGDTIKADQSLITVESDKASMEIPSSHAGVVKELKVKVGDKVAEGSPLLVLEESWCWKNPAPPRRQRLPPPLRPQPRRLLLRRPLLPQPLPHRRRLPPHRKARTTPARSTSNAT
jgi:pyruvate/2-oxoglutarate dehydrogenase complex dihydrolipoamide acyltransferase (E2) component